MKKKFLYLRFITFKIASDKGSVVRFVKFTFPRAFSAM